MSDDDKILCKYGAECYQKNPFHHAKYKHPKKRSVSPVNNAEKKRKIETLDPSDESCSSTTVSKASVEIENKEELESNVKDTSTSLNLDDRKKLIKTFFLVDMPQDFYDFWKFCKDLNNENPKEAFQSINLQLVGPFDILACSKIENKNVQHLLHWRYYYDPPEFQTVIKGDDKTGYHIGYFRDAPGELPSFVADNQANVDCIIKPIGENIFGAINTYLNQFLSKMDPFKKMKLIKLQEKLRQKAKQLNLDISSSTTSMKNRNRNSVCKTLHSAGIVVPYNRKTELGYRPLSVSYKELVKICDQVSKASAESKTKALSNLYPVITAATIALDECDFGTGLELGINLFCYGHESLHISALRMLKSSYTLLDREVFFEIAETHLENRKKGMPYVANYE